MITQSYSIFLRGFYQRLFLLRIAERLYKVKRLVGPKVLMIIFWLFPGRLMDTVDTYFLDRAFQLRQENLGGQTKRRALYRSSEYKTGLEDIKLNKTHSRFHLFVVRLLSRPKCIE